MKFEVFTMARNKWMDGLLLEFRARLLDAKVLKYNLPYLDSEQIRELDRGSAECWNNIARILLNVESYESEDEVIEKCSQALGKMYADTKYLEATMWTLAGKEKQLADFYEKIVGSKSISTDGIFAVYYLRKMYEYLESDLLRYVDENLKNEMFERLKFVETI